MKIKGIMLPCFPLNTNPSFVCTKTDFRINIYPILLMKRTNPLEI